ncbi:MAG: hypothetical protein BWY85_02383 [Firmicutes bacterium ADurb.Bin506]|nr:MAG: hypothetical protein BWY85_02383 [Firmicutes bacterium ADurb.Bin506]
MGIRNGSDYSGGLVQGQVEVVGLGRNTHAVHCDDVDIGIDYRDGGRDRRPIHRHASEPDELLTPPARGHT